MSGRHFVLAAGGTGGHMIPAHALAEELIKRGHRVALITDERGAKIPGLFDGVQTHLIPAGRITKNPMSWVGGVRAILTGRTMSLRLFETFKPSAVIGFGGYPAFPVLLAARKAKIKSAVHEQNAVLGRVNRMVAGQVNAIALSYPRVERLADKFRSKAWLVGNPVRDEVIRLREQPYPLLDEDSVFRVLVVGGSQGASILSDVVPEGLSMLPLNLRRRLQVTQQCRAEDIEAVRAKYKELGIAADLATYLGDLPQRLGWAHLVVARAGASTIAELTCAGRPAILVPLPTATDDHQSANVLEMEEAGGARAIQQSQFTAKELAKQMQRLGLDPDALTNAAGRARSVGRPNATRDLADLVEGLDRPVAPQAVGVAQAFKVARAST
jgi:UDP-N-acetylglucosamine--N-acetylmuramyl-(pentapeptide) pyrophosphoryl-undecaprenol N-acetylglucosamine transferase